jgi:molybdopterin/thiamine biosynthesis adenylyltransferase
VEDAELLRHARHLLLEDWGVEGQAKVARAGVLVVGCGGLGSPVALFLAGAGIGRLVLADGDTVSLTNLQRQIAHATDRIGVNKAVSAARSARALDPSVRVEAVEARLEGAHLRALVAGVDAVVDCSDNAATRRAVNAACVATGTPLVFGAAIGFDGQLTTFDPRDAASPCYACAFPPAAGDADAACATVGVFAPLVGIVGSAQAAEALKLVAGIGRSLVGRLLLVDARRTEWTELALARDPACPVCAPARAAAPVAGPTSAARLRASTPA